MRRGSAGRLGVRDEEAETFLGTWGANDLSVATFRRIHLELDGELLGRLDSLAEGPED